MSNITKLITGTNFTENQSKIAQYMQVALADPSKALSIGECVALFYSDVPAERQSLYELCKHVYGATKSEVNVFLNIERIKLELGFYPSNAKDYVEEYMQKENIGVTYCNDFYYMKCPKLDGEVLTEDDLKDRLVSAHSFISNNRNLTKERILNRIVLMADEYKFKWGKDLIAISLEEWIEEKRTVILRDIYDDIGVENKVWHENNSLMAELVQKAFDPKEYDIQVIESVVRKFIWQVKRKMIGLPVTNHLMPVIISSQGLGKTTLINHLLKPVLDLKADTDFSQIEDDRNIDIWSNYVLFFDEMSKANKADMEVLKNRITTPKLSSRIMKTNLNTSYTNNATFIGCANMNLDQLIQDTTGNRRFFPLYMSKNFPKHWDWLNGIDPKQLWKSVCEHDPDPTLEFMGQIKDIQSGVRVKSVVEEWFEACSDYWKRNYPNGIGAKELYNTIGNDMCFKVWKGDYHPHHKMLDSLNAFGSELTRLIDQDMIKASKQRKAEGVRYIFG